MSAILSSPAQSFPTIVLKQLRRIGPLGVIILLHVALFYALQSGLVRHAAQAFPKEVFASFITPEPAPEPAPKPEPAKPKTVPVVKKQVTRPKPTPVVNTTPSEQAITAPVAPSPPSNEPPAEAAPPAPAVAAASPAAAVPKTISGVSYIQAPQPEYPAIARRMGDEGTVTLRVLVNEKGRPDRADIQKSSGSSRLDEAARQAVLRALFKPHVEDGKPVAVYAIVPIKFQLNN
jgi:protein TonB